MTRALLVEDDAEVRVSLARSLVALDYSVVSCDRGVPALDKVLSTQLDVILLDLGLPDIDGVTLLSMLRSISSVPVIVVTARDQEEWVIRLLELGADDYVTKPFTVAHLNARIRAVLRRSQQPNQGVIRIGELVVDGSQHLVTLNGMTLRLRNLEYQLLLILALAEGRVVGSADIAQQLWGESTSEAIGRLDVHLSWLRSALGETARSPRYLHRLRGVGIRLAAPSDERP